MTGLRLGPASRHGGSKMTTGGQGPKPQYVEQDGDTKKTTTRTRVMTGLRLRPIRIVTGRWL